jgi:hypothetical protein
MLVPFPLNEAYEVAMTAKHLRGSDGLGSNH